jgi:hypothetical protein
VAWCCRFIFESKECSAAGLFAQRPPGWLKAGMSSLPRMSYWQMLDAIDRETPNRKPCFSL